MKRYLTYRHISRFLPIPESVHNMQSMLSSTYLEIGEWRVYHLDPNQSHLVCFTECVPKVRYTNRDIILLIP